MFPPPKLSFDPQTGVARRHLFEERLNQQLKKAVMQAGIDIRTAQKLLGYSDVSIPSTAACGLTPPLHWSAASSRSGIG